MGKHTPTPWKLDDRAPEWPPHLVGADGHVALVMNKSHVAYEANAAFIVKAVNSHDALVEALRAAREVVKVAEALTSSRGDDDWIWGVLSKIDAALETPANPIEEVVDATRQD